MSYEGGAHLCWVDFSNSPVLGLEWGLLHPGLHQDTLIRAFLVQPLMAVKHIADVGCQVQHVNIPAVEPHKLHASAVSAIHRSSAKKLTSVILIASRQRKGCPVSRCHCKIVVQTPTWCMHNLASHILARYTKLQPFVCNTVCSYRRKSVKSLVLVGHNRCPIVASWSHPGRVVYIAYIHSTSTMQTCYILQPCRQICLTALPRP